MKTVAIVGSPRKDGNCDILVNKLLEKIDGEKSKFNKEREKHWKTRLQQIEKRR